MKSRMILKHFLFGTIFSFMVFPIYASLTYGKLSVTGQATVNGGFAESAVGSSNLLAFGDGNLRLNFDHVDPTGIYSSSHAHFVFAQDSSTLPLFLRRVDWLYHVTPLTLHISDAKKNQTYLYVDSLNIVSKIGESKLTVGRQHIKFSHGLLQKPLDIFNIYQYNYINRDYTAGSDAIRLDYPINTKMGVNFVVAPAQSNLQKGVTWDASALIARMYSNYMAYDVSILGGKVYNGYDVGGGIAKTIHGTTIYGEGVVNIHSVTTKSIAPKDLWLLHATNFTGAIGASHTWFKHLGTQVEYYYNSMGIFDFHNLKDLVSTYSIYSIGLLPNFSEHIATANVFYSFTPKWIANMLTVVSIANNSSVFLQPSLTYVVVKNLDLTAKYTVGLGKATTYDAVTHLPNMNSEFGNARYSAQLQLKYSF